MGSTKDKSIYQGTEAMWVSDLEADTSSPSQDDYSPVDI